MINNHNTYQLALPTGTSVWHRKILYASKLKLNVLVQFILSENVFFYIGEYDIHSVWL